MEALEMHTNEVHKTQDTRRTGEALGYGMSGWSAFFFASLADSE